MAHDGLGHTLAKECFPHLSRKKALRLNNGSFGASPTEVLDQLREARDRWLEDPDWSWYQEIDKGQAYAAMQVAEVVHCSSDSLALVENLTVANAIISEWVVRDALENAVMSTGKRRAVLLQSSFTYNAVKNSFRAAAIKLARAGVDLEIVSVEIPFPGTTRANIIEAYEKTFEMLASREPSSLRLACFDHIVSNPSMVMPLDSLIPMARAAGFAHTFVDGAHVPGMIASLNVSAIGASFYAANLHKWMFAPTSAAFLCCEDASLRKQLHHPITSHSADETEADETPNNAQGLKQGFLGECRMVGTHDYAPLLTVPVALAFYKKLDMGIEGGLPERNRQLALNAARVLCTGWGTSLGTSEELVGSTVMVGMPPELGSTLEDGLRLHDEFAKAPFKHVVDVSNGVYESITIQVPIPGSSQTGTGPQLFVRISAAAYNYIEEYEVFRDVILRIVEEKRNSPSN